MTGERFGGRAFGRPDDSFQRSAADRRSTLRKSEGGYPQDRAEGGRAAFGSAEEPDADGSASCLSCFVEVHFMGKRQRTSAVDSNAPIWNEQVRWGWHRHRTQSSCLHL